jgi:hypothetical protein
VYDAHTKEIDLVNRDPKHLNDDVVKVSWGSRRSRCQGSTAPLWQTLVHPGVVSPHTRGFLSLVREGSCSVSLPTPDG